MAWGVSCERAGWEGSKGWGERKASGTNLCFPSQPSFTPYHGWAALPGLDGRGVRQHPSKPQGSGSWPQKPSGHIAQASWAQHDAAKGQDLGVKLWGHGSGSHVATVDGTVVV